MKTLTFTFILFIGLFLTTCKKDNSGGSDNTLTGKWKLTQTLADPGNGSEKWMQVPQKTNYDYVTFNSGGKLGGTVFSTDVAWAVKDSVTLTFTSKDNILQNYCYSIKNGTLVMSPAGPIMCIEGCGIKFIKVR